jgi:transcriptional regulator with XRE-family HTH domain
VVARRTSKAQLPAEAWRDAEMRRAWRTRDFRAVFGLARRRGLSPEGIAGSTGLPVDLVLNVMKGNAVLGGSSGVAVQVAIGLGMPDDFRRFAGLAPPATRPVPDAQPREVRSGRRDHRAHVGERIAELRRARGLTQESLAERAGISRESVGKIEGNSRSPSLAMLEKLANALEVPVSKLLESSAPRVRAARSPDFLPAELLAKPDFIEACGKRDLGRIFRLAVDAGFKVSHLARRCEMSPGQVGGYMWRCRPVRSVAIFDRVSDGLHIPGAMLGIGRRPWESGSDAEIKITEHSENAEITFGVTLTGLMEERGIGVRELARRTDYTPGYISNLRNGVKAASPKVAGLLDSALEANGRLVEMEQKAARQPSPRRIGTYARPSALPSAEVHAKTPQEARAGHSGTIVDSAITEDYEEMERRRLLQSLAALGVNISPLGHALETVRTVFGDTIGYDDRNNLDHWEETVVEYGYSYLATSPTSLIPELAADLIAIRSIVRRIPRDSSDYQSWCRVSGALSGLMAKSLSNLGQSRYSRQWWNMAQHLVDVSGDHNLGLWVRGQRIIHGLYENRPFQVLSRQADAATGFAHGHICAGLADVSTGRAQVSVLSGDYLSAERELHRSEDILSQLPPSVTEDTSSVMGWGEAQLRYTEAWVYAHMGNETETDRAIERALQLYPESDSRSPAQAKLMQAFARIRSGDINEGIRHARAVYEPLVTEQRTTMVDALALQVLNSIPLEAQKRVDVTEYRSLVATSSQRMIEP